MEQGALKWRPGRRDGRTGADALRDAVHLAEVMPEPWTTTSAPAGPGRTEIFKVEKIDHFNTPPGRQKYSTENIPLKIFQSVKQLEFQEV